MSNLDSTGVLPGPLREDEEERPELEPQRRRPLSGRRGLILNLFILVAVGLVVALIAVDGPRQRW